MFCLISRYCHKLNELTAVAVFVHFIAKYCSYSTGFFLPDKQYGNMSWMVFGERGHSNKLSCFDTFVSWDWTITLDYIYFLSFATFVPSSVQFASFFSSCQILFQWVHKKSIDPSSESNREVIRDFSFLFGTYSKSKWLRNTKQFKETKLKGLCKGVPLCLPGKLTDLLQVIWILLLIFRVRKYKLC